MRKTIAGMQVSLDGKIAGPDGETDWVDAWSDTFDLPLGDIDLCVLGAAMYPGYEQYWSGIAAEPSAPLDAGGRTATPQEVEYARFATTTPHYVLSRSLDAARWPATRFLRSAAEVAPLRAAEGKLIYVVGGARTIGSLLDLGLIDELRLTLHPLIAGAGAPLFAGDTRHGLDWRAAQAHADGRIGLTYGLADARP